MQRQGHSHGARAQPTERRRDLCGEGNQEARTPPRTPPRRAHIHTHKCTHTHTHTNAHTHINAHTQKCTHTNIHTHTNAHAAQATQAEQCNRGQSSAGQQAAGAARTCRALWCVWIQVHPGWRHGLARYGPRVVGLLVLLGRHHQGLPRLVRHAHGVLLAWGAQPEEALGGGGADRRMEAGALRQG